MPGMTAFFEARDDHGNNKGDYEMFVDVTPPAGGNYDVSLNLPTGWTLKGVNVYPLTQRNNKVTPSADKQRDMSTLNSGNLASYQAVFDGTSHQVNGISWQGGPTPQILITPTSSDVGLFAYLLWIQDESQSNDYIDPGLRNRG